MKKQVKVKPPDPIPEVEWWDEWILTPESKEIFKTAQSPISIIKGIHIINK